MAPKIVRVDYGTKTGAYHELEQFIALLHNPQKISLTACCLVKKT
jgi:hypothetical protein